MNRRWTTAFMALVLALAAMLEAAGSAAAQGQSKLPQTRQPQSARFDITGRLDIAGESLTITGSGALSGNNFEESITFNLPPSLAQPGSPSSITTRIMMVDGKMYVEVPDTTGTGQTKWYVMDVPMTSGQAGTMNPQFEEALTVTNEGAETLNGAATTRYRVDVDMAKLQAAMGQSGASLQGSTMTMYMWVGDADQYLHKISMNITIALPSEVQGMNLAMEMALTFRDFDQPVTITAPASAEPLNIPGLTGTGMQVGAGAPGMTGDLLGTPLGLFMNAGVSAPPAGTAPTVGTEPAGGVGMPRTGGGGEMLPVALLAVALASVAGGAALRRRASVRG